MLNDNANQRTSYVWSRTAIWATSHAHDYRIVTEAIYFAYLLDFIDEQWKVLENINRLVKSIGLVEELNMHSFGFRHCQT